MEMITSLLTLMGLGGIVDTVSQGEILWPTVIVSAVVAAAIRGYLSFAATYYLPGVLERLPSVLRGPVGAFYVYLRNIYLSLDMMACAALGGLPRETISGRLGRWSMEGSKLTKPLARILSIPLNLMDDGHTYKAYVAEKALRKTLETT